MMTRLYAAVAVLALLAFLGNAYIEAAKERERLNAALELSAAREKALAEQVAGVATEYQRQIEVQGEVLAERDKHLQGAEQRLRTALRRIAEVQGGECFDRAIPSPAAIELRSLPGVAASQAVPPPAGGAEQSAGADASPENLSCRSTANWVAEYNATLLKCNEDKAAISRLVEEYRHAAKEEGRQR